MTWLRLLPIAGVLALVLLAHLLYQHNKTLRADLALKVNENAQLTEFNKQAVKDIAEQNRKVEGLQAELEKQRKATLDAQRAAYRREMERPVHKVGELGPEPHKEVNRWFEQYQ